MQNARIDLVGNDPTFPQPFVAEAATSVDARDFDDMTGGTTPPRNRIKDMIGDHNAPFTQPIVAEAACDFEAEDPLGPKGLDECEEVDEGPFIVPGSGG